jgi:hypothetical protein
MLIIYVFLWRGKWRLCNVCGITLNYNAYQLVNFYTIKDLVLNRPTNSTVTVHTTKKIKRKRDEAACVYKTTEPEDKIYRISFFKKRRRDDNTSDPLGYKPVAWWDVILSSALNTDVRFKHPFTCIIDGQTGLGKSIFCVRVLQKLNPLCTEHRFERGILWCFSERTSSR